MSLEKDIVKFEFYDLNDARLFYDTVGGLLSKVGFVSHFENYFGVKSDFVVVRKDFEGFTKLLSAKGTFKDISFVQMYQGIDGSIVRAMTGYPDVGAFKNKVFSYYAIGSTSTLGLNLPVVERAKVLNVDKSKVARMDFDNRLLTKVGSHYLFTLLSLYKAVEDSRPVLRPHYDYKC